MKQLLFIVSLFLVGIGNAQTSISQLQTYTGSSSGNFVPIVVNGSTKKIDARRFGIDTLYFNNDTLKYKKGDSIINKKLPAYIKGYTEYRVRLLQTSTSSPSYQFSFINEVDNNSVSVSDINYRNVGYARTSTGTYTVTFSYNPAKTYYSTDLDIAFSDAKMRLGGVTSGGNGTTSYQVFTFYSYDLSGNLADNIIVNSSIYIRLYR